MSGEIFSNENSLGSQVVDHTLPEQHNNFARFCAGESGLCYGGIDAVVFRNFQAQH
jgi:hypothetical protein